MMKMLLTDYAESIGFVIENMELVRNAKSNFGRNKQRTKKNVWNAKTNDSDSLPICLNLQSTMLVLDGSN